MSKRYTLRASRVAVQVEQYLTDIINKMRGELREITDRSVQAYPTKPRDEWIFDWPSQIILVVNQIFWCMEVEEAFLKLGKGQKNAMQVRLLACRALIGSLL